MIYKYEEREVMQRSSDILEIMLSSNILILFLFLLLLLLFSIPCLLH